MNKKIMKSDRLKREYLTFFKKIQTLYGWQILQHGTAKLLYDLSPPGYNNGLFVTSHLLEMLETMSQVICSIATCKITCLTFHVNFVYAFHTIICCKPLWNNISEFSLNCSLPWMKLGVLKVFSRMMKNVMEWTLLHIRWRTSKIVALM